MASTATLPAFLSTLTESLESACSSAPEPIALTLPADGISLLDTKNELLLTYLQNLVFLILLKLRNQNPSRQSSPLDDENQSSFNDEVTRKLVELRVYIEKGVRPLESRLKYQVDKLLLAASEASAAPAINGSTKVSRVSDGGANTEGSVASDSDTSPAPPPHIPDLAHRPNPSAFARTSRDDRSIAQENSGLYRPPRITPTSLPTTERKLKAPLKPRKSATLDTFIREEMEDAPIAEPSIGAGSGLRGKEKDREEERRGYEEQRLVRLPEEKKKGRRRAGEDLSGGLGGLGDIDFGDLKGGRKRKGDRGGDGEGERIGERWEKRVKKGVGRKRR